MTPPPPSPDAPATGSGARRARLGHVAFGARVGHLAFGVWALAAVVMAVVPVWVVVSLTRRETTRWAAVGCGTRLARRLMGLPVTVTGGLPDQRPLVVVCNHTSMIDGLVVALALPGPLSFVVTSRFATTPVLGSFLARLGTVFVGGGRAAGEPRRHDAVDRMADVLDRGRALVVFPEAGLAPGPGLGAFHHGAFVAAGRARAAVVPVALTGTRGVLPPRHRLPRRVPVGVVVGSPVASPGGGWSEAVALTEEVRRLVARQAGVTTG